MCMRLMDCRLLKFYDLFWNKYKIWFPTYFVLELCCSFMLVMDLILALRPVVEGGDSLCRSHS